MSSNCIQDKYKNMEKDKYEQMLKNTKKKQQMEGSSRDCMMLLDNGKNNMVMLMIPSSIFSIMFLNKFELNG